MRAGEIARQDPYWTVAESNQESLISHVADALTSAYELGMTYGQAMVDELNRATVAGGNRGDILARAKEIVAAIVDRVREVVSNIFQGGQHGQTEEETYQAAEEAVEDLVEHLPETVSATEIHAAVEEAVSEVFEEEGIDYVEWRTEPGACEICLANEDAGTIERETMFSSGDMKPPSHPRCRCNLVPAEKPRGKR